MDTKVITVDFAKKYPKLKPVCGITGGPRRGGVGLPLDLTEAYSDLKPSAVRIADVEPPYGTNRFLDVHCIFPDFSADESLPDSYDFTQTDEYINSSLAIGSELYIRLGETPDPYPNPRYGFPSCSFKKWARICEHIVMHYNEGWANGFKLGLKNFEIWSYADEDDSWCGTRLEYYEFYRTVACHLHGRFPRLRLGGYGAGGFAALNRIDVSEKQRYYHAFLTGFLKYISDPKTKAPLDFLTWRCDALTPEETAVHSRYARSALDEFGFRRARSIITELSVAASRTTEGKGGAGYFATLASALTVLSKSEVDLVFTNTLDSFCGGLFELGRDASYTKKAGFFTHAILSEMTEMSNRVETMGDSRGELYSVASHDGDRAGLFIVSRAFSGRIELRFMGLELTSASVTRITDKGPNGAPLVRKKENISLTGSKIAISAENSEVFYLSFA